MNKSLQVKLSVTLLATVFLTMIVSVLVNNFFLVDYYISGKQQTLLSVYNRINEMYNTFGVVGSGEKGPSDESNIDLYQWFREDGASTLENFLDMELSMEQLSQNNNISILLYRIQNKRIINQQAVYDMQVLFSSSGTNSSDNSDVENFAIYRDYIQSDDRTNILNESENIRCRRSLSNVWIYRIFI